jgi:hypothetical protein
VRATPVLDNEDDRRSSRELVEQSVHETAMLQKAVPIYLPALPVHPGDRRPLARRFASDCEYATNVRYCNWTNRRHLGESGILMDKKQLDANTHQTLAKR